MCDSRFRPWGSPNTGLVSETSRPHRVLVIHKLTIINAADHKDRPRQTDLTCGKCLKNIKLGQKKMFLYYSQNKTEYFI